MNRWRAEYDDGIWRFYRDGMELSLYEKGDVVVDALNVAESRIAELEGLVRELLAEGTYLSLLNGLVDNDSDWRHLVDKANSVLPEVTE